MRICICERRGIGVDGQSERVTFWIRISQQLLMSLCRVAHVLAQGLNSQAREPSFGHYKRIIAQMVCLYDFISPDLDSLSMSIAVFKADLYMIVLYNPVEGCLENFFCEQLGSVQLFAAFPSSCVLSQSLVHCQNF